MANLVLVGASWSLSLTKSRVGSFCGKTLQKRSKGVKGVKFSVRICVSHFVTLFGAPLFERSVGRSA